MVIRTHNLLIFTAHGEPKQWGQVCDMGWLCSMDDENKENVGLYKLRGDKLHKVNCQVILNWGMEFNNDK